MDLSSALFVFEAAMPSAQSPTEDVILLGATTATELARNRERAISAGPAPAALAPSTGRRGEIVPARHRSTRFRIGLRCWTLVKPLTPLQHARRKLWHKLPKCLLDVSRDRPMPLKPFLMMHLLCDLAPAGAGPPVVTAPYQETRSGLRRLCRGSVRRNRAVTSERLI